MVGNVVSRVASLALSCVLHLALVGSVLALVPGETPRMFEAPPVELVREAPSRVEPPPPPKSIVRPKHPVRAPLPEPAAPPPEARQPDPPSAPAMAAAAPAPAAPPPGPPADRSPVVSVQAPPGPAAELMVPRGRAPVAAPGPAVAARTPDGPPRLARPRGGYQVRPSYPASARRLGVEGTSLLRVYVAADGRVTDVQVDQSAGHPDLDRAAVEAVRRWQFEPGRRGDEPIGMWVELPVQFVLR